MSADYEWRVLLVLSWKAEAAYLLQRRFFRGWISDRVLERGCLGFAGDRLAVFRGGDFMDK